MIVLPFAVKVSRTYLPEAPDTGFIVRYPYIEMERLACEAMYAGRLYVVEELEALVVGSFSFSKVTSL